MRAAGATVETVDSGRAKSPRWGRIERMEVMVAQLVQQNAAEQATPKSSPTPIIPRGRSRSNLVLSLPQAPASGRQSRVACRYPATLLYQ